MESSNVVRLARLARRRLARKEAGRQARHDATRNRVRFFPDPATVAAPEPVAGPVAMDASRAVSIAACFGDEAARLVEAGICRK